MERPRPDQHKDFEVMVREFISLKYDPDYNGFTLFGRNGQRQYGCDIKDHAAKLIVQCKCYDNLKSGIYNKLFNAIKGDYEKARKHFNSMELFVVCTTLDNCSEITNRIKSLESMYEKQIPIHVYFWDSIEASINNSYTANKQYAEDFEKPLFLHKGNYRVCLRNLYGEQKYRDFSSEKQKKTKSESSSDLFQRIKVQQLPPSL